MKWLEIFHLGSHHSSAKLLNFSISSLLIVLIAINFILIKNLFLLEDNIGNNNENCSIKIWRNISWFYSKN